MRNLLFNSTRLVKNYQIPFKMAIQLIVIISFPMFALGQTRTYNDYVGMPVETYTNVGIYKQKQYENRIEIIQDLLGECGPRLSKLVEIDSEKYGPLNDKYIQKVNELNKSQGVSSFEVYMYYKTYFTNLRRELINLLGE